MASAALFETHSNDAVRQPALAASPQLLQLPSPGAQLASLRLPATPKARVKPAKEVKPVKPAYVGTTPSLYERTTSPAALRLQGCESGRAKTSGLVVLDFGQQAGFGGTYGTITFAKRFASNAEITAAVEAYAAGYSACLPRHAAVHITLARGTSNYAFQVSNTYAAGQHWAAEIVAVGDYLRVHHLERVTAAAAIDAEPAWDREFHDTYNFFRGYATADRGYLLYNYGSLDGGVGSIWNLGQAYYVAGGMREARAIPEIYNHAMAEEWARLARLSVVRYGRPIKLAGLMTQHSLNCTRCGYRASMARHVLAGELAKARVAAVPKRTLASITNIASP